MQPRIHEWVLYKKHFNVLSLSNDAVNPKKNSHIESNHKRNVAWYICHVNKDKEFGINFKSRLSHYLSRFCQKFTQNMIFGSV